MPQNINNSSIRVAWYTDGLSELTAGNIFPAVLSWDYSARKLIFIAQPQQQAAFTVFELNAHDVERVHLSTSQIIIFSKNQRFTLESNSLLNSYANTYIGGAKLGALLDASFDLRNSPESKSLKEFLKQNHIRATQFSLLKTILAAVVILFTSLTVLVLVLNFIASSSS